MTPFAFIEHLEKIPYLFSLFLPVALFFFAGLGLAWLFWYRHARRLGAALLEHDKLSADFTDVCESDYDLSARFKELFGKHKKQWNQKLSESKNEIVKLNKDLSSGGGSQLKGKFTSLQATLGKRDQELSALKVDFANLEKSSATKQTQSGQNEGTNPAELTRLRDELSALKVSQKGTKDQLARATADLAKERSKKPTPSGSASFFVNTEAVEDQALGYLYPSKPDQVDDLTKIKGISYALEPRINDLGIYQYKQIALWSQANRDAFSARINTKGCAKDEQWVNQAVDLHRQHHRENLTPLVNIYQNPEMESSDVSAAAPVVKSEPHPPRPVARTSGLPREFDGQPIRVDHKLGVLFTEKPTKIDDLKRIKGVAGVLEARLHEFGLYRFKQIEIWTDEQVAEFSEQLSFPGRIERDEWVKQATAFHAEKYGQS